MRIKMGQVVLVVTLSWLEQLLQPLEHMLHWFINMKSFEDGIGPKRWKSQELNNPLMKMRFVLPAREGCRTISPMPYVCCSYIFFIKHVEGSRLIFYGGRRCRGSYTRKVETSSLCYLQIS